MCSGRNSLRRFWSSDESSETFRRTINNGFHPSSEAEALLSLEAEDFFDALEAAVSHM